jgi:hypothetical protein
MSGIVDTISMVLTAVLLAKVSGTTAHKMESPSLPRWRRTCFLCLTLQIPPHVEPRARVCFDGSHLDICCWPSSYYDTSSRGHHYISMDSISISFAEARDTISHGAEVTGIPQWSVTCSFMANMTNSTRSGAESTTASRWQELLSPRTVYHGNSTVSAQ